MESVQAQVSGLDWEELAKYERKVQDTRDFRGEAPQCQSSPDKVPERGFHEGNLQEIPVSQKGLAVRRGNSVPSPPESRVSKDKESELSRKEERPVRS